MADEEKELEGERRTAPAPPRAGRSSHDDAELSSPGAVIDGKYRVERVLGAGGMGVVVAAMHLGLNERVALKFVRIAEAPPELVDRLRREARIAFRIKSEHVARLYDVGTLPSGAPYLVMEYLAGQDFAGVLAERGPLPIAEVVDYVLQACEAMAEAHGLGVVHRDLKPSNLFLTRGADGEPLVKVLDFGIAKAAFGPGGSSDSITVSSSVLGSPLYMSPEQVRGVKEVDARCDVWSLGVILHELLTGAPPFVPGPASAVCAAIVADAPERVRGRRAEAPEELEAVVLRCLEKDPARRFAGVGALAAALAPFASDASDTILKRIGTLTLGVAREPDSEEPGHADRSITLSAWNARTPAPRRPIRSALLPLAVAAFLVLGAAWAFSRRAPAPGSSVAIPSSSREVPAPVPEPSPRPVEASAPEPPPPVAEATATARASAPEAPIVVATARPRSSPPPAVRPQAKPPAQPPAAPRDSFDHQ